MTIRYIVPPESMLKDEYAISVVDQSPPGLEYQQTSNPNEALLWWSESVDGWEREDITVTGAELDVWEQQDGMTRVTWRNADPDGRVSLHVAAESVEDQAGNVNAEVDMPMYSEMPLAGGLTLAAVLVWRTMRAVREHL